MLLEQIERRQKRLMEERKKMETPNVRLVPAGELDPEKSMRAEDYVTPKKPSGKTMGLKLSIETHDRIDKLTDKLSAKSKKQIVLRALEIGLKQLEAL